MLQVEISKELKSKCPNLVLGLLECNVQNSISNKMLWKEIEIEISNIRNMHTMESIKQIPSIAATRSAYKSTGKDPNRYRPSTESMYRRILKGNSLYRISTVVDLINLVALRTGYSLGVFDAEQICGSVVAGIGAYDEVFHGIGRGKLNIEGMPVIRDAKGGIGTPTSDEERTAFQLHSTKLFVNINSYLGEDGLKDAIDFAENLLCKYASAKNVCKQIV